VTDVGNLKTFGFLAFETGHIIHLFPYWRHFVIWSPCILLVRAGEWVSYGRRWKFSSCGFFFFLTNTLHGLWYSLSFLQVSRRYLLYARWDCIAVVCEVVCYTEVRHGLSGKKLRWHFS